MHRLAGPQGPAFPCTKRDNRKEKSMAYTIDNPLDNPRFLAATCRAHLRLIAAGLLPRRGLTKGEVLAKAGSLTGQSYKRGEYGKAIADLTTFLKSFDMES
jgi:hypothetical protein